MLIHICTSVPEIILCISGTEVIKFDSTLFVCVNKCSSIFLSCNLYIWSYIATSNNDFNIARTWFKFFS